MNKEQYNTNREFISKCYPNIEDLINLAIIALKSYCEESSCFAEQIRDNYTIKIEKGEFYLFESLIVVEEDKYLKIIINSLNIIIKKEVNYDNYNIIGNVPISFIKSIVENLK